MNKPLALTCGDPAGIGPELIAILAKENPEADLRVFGPAGWLAENGIEGVAVGPEDFRVVPGEPGEAGARVALEALEAAARACREEQCSAVVTGPVSKHAMARIGFNYPGQTEFFADRWGGEPVMAFVGQSLRVVLATWHCALREVPEILERDPERLNRAVAEADRLARSAGIAEPRIAVCGLNPHAGEAGLLGHEEALFLLAQLEILRQDFPGLVGPLPGDTVFWRLRQGEFDVAVALYHDQGLGPLKTLEFDRAVNVTMGLPWVRTSPDHGTAFDRAGRGVADPTSFRHALTVARDLASHRADGRALKS